MGDISGGILIMVVVVVERILLIVVVIVLILLTVGSSCGVIDLRYKCSTQIITLRR